MPNDYQIEMSKKLNTIAEIIGSALEQMTGENLPFVLIINSEQQAMYVGNTPYDGTLAMAKAFVASLEGMDTLQRTCLQPMSEN